jgi:hypothetical protein
VTGGANGTQPICVSLRLALIARSHPTAAQARFRRMAKPNRLPGDSEPTARFESTAAKRRRLAHEAGLLAEARAEIAVGLIVDSAEVDAWIDSIDTDRELPPPYPRR